jgi:hypothetical protein
VSASAASVPVMHLSRSKVSARIGNTSAAPVGWVSVEPRFPGQFLGRGVVVDDPQEIDVAITSGLAARP